MELFCFARSERLRRAGRYFIDLLLLLQKRKEEIRDILLSVAPKMSYVKGYFTMGDKNNDEMQSIPGEVFHAVGKNVSIGL